MQVPTYSLTERSGRIRFQEAGMHISVVGLGKLGAPLAAVLADRGHHVVGSRQQPRRSQSDQRRARPVQEPGLVYAGRSGPLRLTQRPTVLPPRRLPRRPSSSFRRPACPQVSSRLSNVLDAIDTIGQGLRRTTAYHPRGCYEHCGARHDGRGHAPPALERASGRQTGHFAWPLLQPRVHRARQRIRDMQNPDFVLIGESDRRAGDTLEQIQRSVVGDSTPVRRMNLVNAEVAKIAVNTCVTTKISYANMLSELCEHLPGGDVSVVTRCHRPRQTNRSAVFQGGARITAAQCFPRDNAAFLAVARARGVNGDIAAATDTVNRRQVSRLAATVESHLAGTDQRVAVLGLSLQPDTNVVEESQG